MRPSCGKTLFGDVDARHDLDAADERAFHLQGNAVADDAFAVNPISNLNAIFHRLNMDIACARANGLGDHRLHQFDNGGLGRVGRPVFADAG